MSAIKISQLTERCYFVAIVVLELNYWTV